MLMEMTTFSAESKTVFRPQGPAALDNLPLLVNLSVEAGPIPEQLGRRLAQPSPPMDPEASG